MPTGNPRSQVTTREGGHVRGVQVRFRRGIR